MKKTWAVARKELRQIARDPLSLIMLIGLPAFMLVLYGFALNFDVRHVALAVQDLDGTRESRDLLSAFVHSTYFDVTEVAGAGDDLERITRRREAKAVLVIPHGFADDLASGRAGAVQLLLDGTDASTAQTILGYAGAITSETNLRLLHGALRRGGARPPALTDYEPRVFYNPELRSTQFLVPGLIGFLLMLTAVLSTAMSVVREKERGTMEQIRVSPVRTVELILGKATPYLVISLVATAIILVAARVLFGVAVRGSYLDLFVVTVLYLIGALGFGLLISTLADTQALAFQIGLLTSLLPAILLSGFIFPIRTMPVVLRAITNLVPARHFLVVLRGIILKGAGLEPYLEQLLALAIFAVLTLGLASLRMSRREA
ncbi:MAG: ABC transporter permease [Vicinamibacteria bacterium]